ncbi:MAG: glycosyltransferase family 39 protein [Rhodospirillales bacterium]|nr:glycosyltransferase family 39 protein [Rhodospirillales bacterium]
MLWALALMAALYFRPLLPVDETRYVGVAWEMWLRGDFLVPYLNGEPYSHKPPLLFWLINLGWGIFGVNDWWPRMVAPLFALGTLGLTAMLGRRLWPNDAMIHQLAPFFLLGAASWGLFGTLTMFDMILAFWVLMGLLGMSQACIATDRKDAVRGWVLFGLAIGMGVLTKGPVILIHLCPAALLGPYWTGQGFQAAGRRWYGPFCLALAGGAGLALLWAVPAGFSGGEAYQNAIFWDQSAGRMVQSFAHSRPFWWYAAILPGLILPWLFWPSLLRGLWRLIRPSPARADAGADMGLRLIIVWVGGTFILLSMISGKGPHYLIPIFPALGLGAALLLARLGAGAGRIGARLDLGLPVLLLMCLGGLLLALPVLAPVFGYGDLALNPNPLWILPLFLGGLWLLLRPPLDLTGRGAGLAILSVLSVAALHGTAGPRLAQSYDLKPLASHIAKLQAQGKAVANYGKYHGQYNFLGRLKQPLAVTGDAEVVQWIKANPGGKIVSYHRKLPKGATPDFSQPFRNRVVAVWDGAAVLKNPDIAKRGAE